MESNLGLYWSFIEIYWEVVPLNCCQLICVPPGVLIPKRKGLELSLPGLLLHCKYPSPSPGTEKRKCKCYLDPMILRIELASDAYNVHCVHMETRKWVQTIFHIALPCSHCPLLCWLCPSVANPLWLRMVLVTYPGASHWNANGLSTLEPFFSEDCIFSQIETSLSSFFPNNSSWSVFHLGLLLFMLFSAPFNFQLGDISEHCSEISHSLTYLFHSFLFANSSR